MTNGKDLDFAKDILQEAERQRHENVSRRIWDDLDEAKALKKALELSPDSITRKLAEAYLQELGDEEAQKSADKRMQEQAALDAMQAAYQAQHERLAAERERLEAEKKAGKEKGCG